MKILKQLQNGNAFLVDVDGEIGIAVPVGMMLCNTSNMTCTIKSIRCGVFLPQPFFVALAEGRFSFAAKDVMYGLGLRPLLCEALQGLAAQPVAKSPFCSKHTDASAWLHPSDDLLRALKVRRHATEDRWVWDFTNPLADIGGIMGLNAFIENIQGMKRCAADLERANYEQTRRQRFEAFLLSLSHDALVEFAALWNFAAQTVSELCSEVADDFMAQILGDVQPVDPRLQRARTFTHISYK